MRKTTVIKILEDELVKPDLPADLRLKYVSEISILRGWKASQGRFVAGKKPRKAGNKITRKVDVWQRWLQSHCPAEYRPQHPSVTMPFGIEDLMVSFIRKICHYRWSIANLGSSHLRHGLSVLHKEVYCQ